MPDLPALEYLNLRETQVETMDELKKFVGLKSLATLNLLGTIPYIVKTISNAGD